MQLKRLDVAPNGSQYNHTDSTHFYRLSENTAGSVIRTVPTIDPPGKKQPENLVEIQKGLFLAW